MLDYGPVHTNRFSFENGYFLIRLDLSSTLIRRLRSPKTKENEAFRKRSPEWIHSKTSFSCCSVDGKRSMRFRYEVSFFKRKRISVDVAYVILCFGISTYHIAWELKGLRSVEYQDWDHATATITVNIIKHLCNVNFTFNNGRMSSL